MALEPTSETISMEGSIGDLRISSGTRIIKNRSPCGSALMATFQAATVEVNGTYFYLNKGPAGLPSRCTFCIYGVTGGTFTNNHWESNEGQTSSGLFLQRIVEDEDGPIGSIIIEHATLIAQGSDQGVYFFDAPFEAVTMNHIIADRCQNGIFYFNEEVLIQDVVLNDIRVTNPKNVRNFQSVLNFRRHSVANAWVTGFHITNDNIDPIFRLQSGTIYMDGIFLSSVATVTGISGLTGLNDLVVINSRFENCGFVVENADMIQVNMTRFGDQDRIVVNGPNTGVILNDVQLTSGKGVVLVEFQSFVGMMLQLHGNNNTGTDHAGGLTAYFSPQTTLFDLREGCTISTNFATRGGGLSLIGDNSNAEILLGRSAHSIGHRSSITKNEADFGGGVFVELTHPEKLVFNLDVDSNVGREDQSQVYIVEQKGLPLNYLAMDPKGFVKGLSGHPAFDSSPVSFKLINPKTECYYEESDVRLFACYLRHVQFYNNNKGIVTDLPPQVRFVLIGCPEELSVCDQPNIQYWDSKTASFQFYIQFKSTVIPEEHHFNLSLFGFHDELLQPSYFTYKMFRCDSITDHYKCNHVSWTTIAGPIVGSAFCLIIIFLLILVCVVYCQFGSIIFKHYRDTDVGQTRKHSPWSEMSFPLCLSRVAFDVLFCCACKCRQEFRAWKNMAKLGDSSTLRCCFCCCQRDQRRGRIRPRKGMINIGGLDGDDLEEEFIDVDDRRHGLS